MLRVRIYVIGNVETDAKRGVPTNHVIFIVILSHILISDARSASLHFYTLMSYIELNQNRYPTDNDGYLKQLEDWSESLAEKIAEKEQIQLTEEHWEIIWLVRDFYQEYKTSPAIRMLVKAMAQKFGEEKGNSRYLQRLFPEGPAKQATKIAGLPKPAKCL